jgi:hypothetical protein
MLPLRAAIQGVPSRYFWDALGNAAFWYSCGLALHSRGMRANCAAALQEAVFSTKLSNRWCLVDGLAISRAAYADGAGRKDPKCGSSTIICNVGCLI